MTVALPQVTSPEALAKRMGWSPRRVRKLAKALGACRILGNRMRLLPVDVEHILAMQAPGASRVPLRVLKKQRIYFALCGDMVKIGLSATPKARVQHIGTGNPLHVNLLKTMQGDRAREREIHRMFAALRVRGEWFQYKGDLVKFIATGELPG